MTESERAQLRIAISDATRQRLFTTDATGKTILKPVYREPIHRLAREGRIVAGIKHGTSWAYRQHGCRCVPCTLNQKRVQKVSKQAKVAA